MQYYNVPEFQILETSSKVYILSNIPVRIVFRAFMTVFKPYSD